MDIDHNPDEPRIDRTLFPWWIGWALIALLWVWYLYFKDFDWTSIAIGLGTGTYLTTWAIEITGNKAPDSWSKKR